jgi:hypothetical protein
MSFSCEILFTVKIVYEPARYIIHVTGLDDSHLRTFGKKIFQIGLQIHSLFNLHFSFSDIKEGGCPKAAPLQTLFTSAFPIPFSSPEVSAGEGLIPPSFLL